ncbi:TPA: hypothetical protein ACKRQV_000229 [Pseudomonas aeruginosa]|nr:hypothetical protein [Pseudomonas aeruginosa]EIU2862510.1 hypothetical protein [Pseudomonas aeruginosa]
MRSLISVLMLLAAAGQAAATEYVKDIQYRLAAATSMRDERDLGLAMVDLIDLACRGDPSAAALLGERYMSGAGEFGAAPGKAKILLRGAAQAGISRAMPGLVLLLSRDGATQPEIQEAAKWRRVGEALSPGTVEMAVASQAFEIARNGRDVTDGYQAAAVWLQKHNLGMVNTKHASIDCRSW